MPPSVPAACPSCARTIDPATLAKLADEAAQGKLEGGDSWFGGELLLTCPHCGEEVPCDGEGHTVVERYAVVDKVVVRRG